MDDRDFVNALRHEAVSQLNFPDHDLELMVTREIKIQTELPRDIKNCHNQRSPAPPKLGLFSSLFLLIVFYFDTFDFFTYTSPFVRGIFALS